MEIGPVSNKPVNLPQSGKEKTETVGAPAVKDNQDKLIISEDAQTKLSELADQKRLLDTSADKVNEKLERIKNRIEAGFYETKEVKEKIIGKLAADILDNKDHFREND